MLAPEIDMYDPGTILQRPLAGHWGKLYYHLGIYLGKGRVIHFNGLPFGDRRRARLEISPLAEFAAGQPLTVYLPPLNKRHGRAMARHARQLKRQRDNPYDRRYHALFKNCEDFCRHCYRLALSDDTTPAELPPSQRQVTLTRLGRALSLGYTGARLGRAAGPYGALVGALAGGLTGALWPTEAPATATGVHPPGLPKPPPAD